MASKLICDISSGQKCTGRARTFQPFLLTSNQQLCYFKNTNMDDVNNVWSQSLDLGYLYPTVKYFWNRLLLNTRFWTRTKWTSGVCGRNVLRLRRQLVKGTIEQPQGVLQRQEQNKLQSFDKTFFYYYLEWNLKYMPPSEQTSIPWQFFSIHSFI